MDIIKGNVTKVNDFFLYFVVDDTYRIYCNFSKLPIKLPYLKNNINISISNVKKLHKSTKTFIMSPKDECICACYNEITESKFYEFLKMNGLSENIDGILELDMVVRKLELFLTDDAILSCLRKLHCATFKASSVRVPKDLRVANTDISHYEFLKFEGQHNFNVYPSTNFSENANYKTDYLIGIVSINNVHGHFTLRDDAFEIIVIFSHSNPNDQFFHNSVVLIKRYAVFTEIFTSKDQPVLNYVLIDSQDVVVLKDHIIGSSLKFYKKGEPCTEKTKYSYFLRALKISEVIYGYESTSQCWIESFVFNEAQTNAVKVYTILPQGLLQIVPYLKEGLVYRILTNNNLKIDNVFPYKELFGLKKIKNVIVLNDQDIFQEIDFPLEYAPANVLNSFNDIKTFVSKAEDYSTVSFELVIKRKRLDEKKSQSWYRRRHKQVPYFGDLTNLQYRLIFEQSDEKSFIDLYLTNRENHVTPLGLIPQMKIIVKHAQVWKRKYLKTNVFTSFKVVSYCPEVVFYSANLYFSDRTTWQWRLKSTPTYLGLFEYIPFNCIVRGILIVQEIFQLDIQVVCKSCRLRAQEEICSRCNSGEKDVKIFMIIKVQDFISQSFLVETENVEFLLELLGLNNTVDVSSFYETCIQCQINLRIDSKAGVKYFGNPDASSIVQEIEKIVCITNRCPFLIDVVCIRQFGDGQRPWRVLEFECLLL